MGIFHHSEATLRFTGDALNPDELTMLLGAEPSASCRKGQELIGRTSGVVRTAGTGFWRLSAARRAPADLESQVFEILGKLTADLSTWQSLSRYAPNLFCGVFMASGNDGMVMSSKMLLALGERGIELQLDVYDGQE